MSACEQELCPNWGGDGDVCPCAVFGLDRPQLATDEECEHGGHDVAPLSCGGRHYGLPHYGPWCPGDVRQPVTVLRVAQ